jgi:UDP-N-acetylglucosamine 1-carboxyvinyltransferase
MAGGSPQHHLGWLRYCLRQLGAEIDIDQGYVVACAPKGVHGDPVTFPKVSVGAIHQVLLASALAIG